MWDMSAEDNTQTKLHGCAHNAERKTNWNLPSLARSNQSAITWVIARAITGVITPLITAAPEWADPGRSAGKLPRKQRGRSPRQHEAPFRRLRRGMAISLKKNEEDKKNLKQVLSSWLAAVALGSNAIQGALRDANLQTAHKQS
jgi:hypothetical protein